MRLVLDTSVLISFLLTRGPATSALLAHWLAEEIEIVTSLKLLAELEETATSERLAGRITASQRETLLRVLRAYAFHILGNLTLPGVTADPDDDMFVEAAVEGEADYIVSRDPHLLALERYGNIEVVTPAEMAEILEGEA